MKSLFYETGFQEKKEFLYFLKNEKLQWVQDILSKYDIPPHSELSISEWTKKSTLDSLQNQTISINITYYFKTKDTPFSHTNDHISMNFTRKNDNIYVLDGLMYFAKQDFVNVTRLLE
ncbi:MAG: hypothetical protein SNJ64_06325 [Endomicrobiia bacterium]